MERVFLLLILLFCLCKTEDFQSPEDKFFTGNHVLIPINKITKEYPKNLDTYVEMTSVSKTGKVNIIDTTLVRFFWRQGDGFILATFPLSKVRFSLVTEYVVDTPYCKFRWSPNSDFKSDSWQDFVVYAVVYVREEHIIRRE
jgi:hypothetical protein